jgi:hypothetical protein
MENDILAQSDKRRLEGQKLAKANENAIKKQIAERDRYQASWGLTNMVKALNIFSWLNTVEDWQRMYEAKIILRERARRKRK